MRKNTKTDEGSARRIVKVFLFWPRTIKYERRWLEWAVIEQRYIVGVNHCAWMDERWTTDEEVVLANDAHALDCLATQNLDAPPPLVAEACAQSRQAREID